MAGRLVVREAGRGTFAVVVVGLEGAVAGLEVAAVEVGSVVAGNLKGGRERIGDWFNVRELCDLGERMVVGLPCWVGDFSVAG